MLSLTVVAVPKKLHIAALQLRILNKGFHKLVSKREGKIMKRAVFVIIIVALLVGGFSGLYLLGPLDFSPSSKPVSYKASSTISLPNYFGKEIGIIATSNNDGDEEAFLYVRTSQFEDRETAYQLMAQLIYEATEDCPTFNNGRFFFYIENPALVKLSLNESYLQNNGSRFYVSYQRVIDFSKSY